MGIAGAAERRSGSRKLEQRHVVGANPHQREVESAPRLEEIDGLLERLRGGPLTGEPAERLHEEISAAEPARPTSQMRDGLGEGRSGRRIALIERGSSQSAEADASK